MHAFFGQFNLTPVDVMKFNRCHIKDVGSHNGRPDSLDGVSLWGRMQSYMAIEVLRSKYQ
jgi:hypothetical protein